MIDRTQIIFGKKTVHELESLSSEASYFKSNFVEIKKKRTKKLNMIIKEKKSIIIVITKKKSNLKNKQIKKFGKSTKIYEYFEVV